VQAPDAQSHAAGENEIESGIGDDQPDDRLAKVEQEQGTDSGRSGNEAAPHQKGGVPYAYIAPPPSERSDSCADEQLGDDQDDGGGKQAAVEGLRHTPIHNAERRNHGRSGQEGFRPSTGKRTAGPMSGYAVKPKRKTQEEPPHWVAAAFGGRLNQFFQLQVPTLRKA
jgi:hypothetical protein